MIQESKSSRNKEDERQAKEKKMISTGPWEGLKEVGIDRDQ